MTTPVNLNSVADDFVIQHELNTDQFAATSIAESMPETYQAILTQIEQGCSPSDIEFAAVGTGQDMKFAHVMMRAARHILREKNNPQPKSEPQPVISAEPMPSIFYVEMTETRIKTVMVLATDAAEAYRLAESGDGELVDTNLVDRQPLSAHSSWEVVAKGAKQ